MKADNNINLYTFTVEVPAGKTVQSYFPLARGIYFKSVKNASGLVAPIRAHFSRDDNTQGQLCTVIEGYSVFNPDNSFNCVVFLNEQATTVTVTCSVSNGQIQYMPDGGVEMRTVFGGTFTVGTTPAIAAANNTRYVFSIASPSATNSDFMTLTSGMIVRLMWIAGANGFFQLTDGTVSYRVLSSTPSVPNLNLTIPSGTWKIVAGATATLNTNQVAIVEIV